MKAKVRRPEKILLVMGRDSWERIPWALGFGEQRSFKEPKLSEGTGRGPLGSNHASFQI